MTRTISSMRKVLLLLISMWVSMSEPLLANSLATADTDQAQIVADCFKGNKGTFLMREVNGAKVIEYNQQGLDEMVSPVSTFKIFVALVGLETGAIKDADSIEKWDGNKTFADAWNKDHNLKTAMAESVNWYFYAVLKRVGKKKIEEYLKLLNYGNQDASSGEFDFWLDKQGSLKISARQQVDFLNRLYLEQLPISKKSQQTVKELLQVESTQKGVLSGKTGTSQENGKLVLGWFVGFVQNDKKGYVFATRYEAESGATGRKAKDISEQIFKQLGLL